MISAFLFGRNRLALICASCFIVTFSIRLGYVFMTKSYLSSERAEVEYIASNLADGRGFSSPFGGITGPSAHTAPGYPWALSLVYRFAGPELADRKLAQQIFSSFLTSISLSLLPLLSTRLGFSILVGALASTILALSPFQLWVETSGAFEQPVSAILLSVTLLAGVSAAFAPLGVVLGIIALTSPSIILVPLSFLCIKSLKDRASFLFALRAAILAVAIVSPWLLRNYLTFDGYFGVRSNFGMEFFLGNNASADGRSFQGSWNRLDSFFSRNHPLSSREEHQSYKAIGEIAYNRARFEAAQEWVRMNPLKFVSLCLNRTSLFFFPPPSLWSENVNAREFRSFFFSLISLLSFFSVGFLFRRKSPHAWPLLAALALPCIPYTLTHVDPRYRYPIVCLSTLLAVEFSISILMGGYRRFLRGRG